MQLFRDAATAAAITAAYVDRAIHRKHHRLALVPIWSSSSHLLGSDSETTFPFSSDQVGRLTDNPEFLAIMSGGNSSVESLLKDAEKLVSRLKTHEKAADLLLGQSDGLHKTIKAKSAYMKVLLDAILGVGRSTW